jgi:hypothetical protein
MFKRFFVALLICAAASGAMAQRVTLDVQGNTDLGDIRLHRR